MPSQTTAVRRVTMLGATLAVAVMGLGAAPLGAATTTTTQPLKSNEYLNGVSVGPATVTTPGSPSRKLDANQTAAFLRTWLPESVLQRLPNEKPAKCLPVSTLRTKTTFERVAAPMVVYYASDGPNVWVGMPAQALGFASVTEEKWIRAPDATGTAKAFNAPGDVPGTTNNCAATAGPTGTTVTKPPKPSSKGSSDSNTWVFVAVPAAIIVAAGIWLLMRTRSRARAA